MSNKQPIKKQQERTAENIQVVVRCRPMNKQELFERQLQVCTVNDKDKEVTITLQMKTNKPTTKSFYFDNVYGPKSTQRDVYLGTVYPIVQEVLEGYNCTLFAYGQTGTGKTYTMEGSRDDPSKWSGIESGIIARSITTIFESLSKHDDYTVKVSHLELYNEELCDLLNTENKNLKIYEDTGSSTSTITVHNLTEIPVYNSTDIFTILEKSWNERRTAGTDLNDFSSRSHCIFSITICMRETTPDGEELLKIGKLNLVDLAGSENIAKSGAKSQTKTEAGMINKSLLTLGRVITALTEHSPHVPYRESKLTRLLQDSLGGATKTCIIATISPANGGSDETLSTLDYASRAKNIRNQPQVNKKISKKEVLKEYTAEISELKAQLDAARRKDGVFLPPEHYNKIMFDLEEYTQRNEILKDQIESKNRECQELLEIYQKHATDLARYKSSVEELTDNIQKQTECLKQTENTLVCTRNDLKESRIVLAEFKETEHQLHSEAQLLLDTLSISIDDVQRLHLKISREETVQESNRQYLDDFKTKVVRDMVVMREDFSKFLQNQKQKYASTNSKLDLFFGNYRKVSDKQDEYVKRNYQVLTEGLSKINEFNHVAVQSAEKYRQQILNYLIQKHGEFDSKTNSIVEYLQGNKKQVENVLCKQGDALKNSTLVGISNVGETETTINNFVELHSKELGALETSVDSNINTGLDKMHIQLGNLSLFAQWQTENDKRLQKDFLEKQLEQNKQMEMYIQNQMSLREQQMAEAVTKLKNQVTTTIQDFLQANKTMKNNTKQIQNHVTSFSETATGQHNNLKQQFTSTNNGVNQLIAAVHSSLDNSTVHFETELKALKQNAITDRQACENLLNESQRYLVSKEKECLEYSRGVAKKFWRTYRKYVECL